MSDGFFTRSKNWIYEKLKSKPAQYISSSVTGIAAASLIAGLCGMIWPLGVAIFIGVIIFGVVTVVTQKNLSASFDAAIAVKEIKPLKEEIKKNSLENKELKQENKELNRKNSDLEAKVAKLEKAITVLINNHPDIAVKKACEGHLASEQPRHLDDLMGIVNSTSSIEMPPLSSPKSQSQRPPWGLFAPKSKSDFPVPGNKIQMNEATPLLEKKMGF